MPGSSAKQNGSCLCQAVRYRVSGPLRPVVNCHCSQCRKQSGHFMPATAAAKADFTLLEDRGLAWYHASEIARRGFCRECGSTLFWERHGADYIAIAAGSLDGPTGLKTTAHIFCADKGDYYDLDDGLPQYPASD
jgi:hypothetical protein